MGNYMHFSSPKLSEVVKLTTATFAPQTAFWLLSVLSRQVK
jgi:hypothetical protein